MVEKSVEYWFPLFQIMEDDSHKQERREQAVGHEEVNKERKRGIETTTKEQRRELEEINVGK